MANSVISLWGVWVHPWMLGWLGAAAAPLLIHLLTRKRYQEVHFAAMQYLLAAVRKNARRIRIENWLLLAVRTALIVLVVLAAAEPMWQRTGVLARTGQPTHKVLVLDTSYSMGYRLTDRTRLDRAKQVASQIVEQSQQGDGFTLLLLNEPPQVIVSSPAFTTGDLLGEINAVKLSHAGGDLPMTLSLIEDVLNRARREHPRLTHDEVYFLTDLGRTTWAPDLDAAALATFRQRSQRLGQSATLSVIDLGQSDAENLAIDNVELTDPIITGGQETTLTAALRNFGRTPRAQQHVELHIAGRRVAERTVDLPPFGSATVTFSPRFEAAGDHPLEVRLTPDALDLDNHRYLVASVKEQLRVLCVDGRPARGRFNSSTDYLAVALAPPLDDHRARARIRVDVIAESGLLDTDLTKYDCVFFCDVAQFTEREANVLQSYVKLGGGLVWFLGEQVQADNYNRQLAPRAGQTDHVLPARLLKASDAGSVAVDPLAYRHPLVAPFRDQEQAGLLTTPIQKYFQLQLAEKSAAQVALALTNGDPLIVTESIGHGHTALVATSADVSWTAMPIWPSYVPIVQELLAWAMRGQFTDRNILVGQTLSGSLANQAANELEITTSAGDTKPAATEGSGVYRSWSFSDTATSGIYRISAPEATSAPAFAVNVNTAEGNLEQVATEELARDVWPDVRYFQRHDWQEASQEGISEIVVRSRLPLWLLAGALALVLSESFLNWFTGRFAR